MAPAEPPALRPLNSSALSPARPLGALASPKCGLILNIWHTMGGAGGYNALTFRWFFFEEKKINRFI